MSLFRWQWAKCNQRRHVILLKQFLSKIIGIENWKLSKRKRTNFYHCMQSVVQRSERTGMLRDYFIDLVVMVVGIDMGIWRSTWLNSQNLLWHVIHLCGSQFLNRYIYIYISIKHTTTNLISMFSVIPIQSKRQHYCYTAYNFKHAHGNNSNRWMKLKYYVILNRDIGNVNNEINDNSRWYLLPSYHLTLYFWCVCILLCRLVFIFDSRHKNMRDFRHRNLFESRQVGETVEI